MKRKGKVLARTVVIAVLTFGIIGASNAQSAEARSPRLSKADAVNEANFALIEYWAARDWTTDWDFYGCRRQSRRQFSCNGTVSGTVYSWDYEYSYERYCDLEIRVRATASIWFSSARVIRSRC